MIKNISNLGDAAVYCDFGSEIDIKVNTNVINFFKSVKKSNIEGITNLAPSYNKLIITFDLAKTNYLKIKKDIENLKILKLDKSEFKKILTFFWIFDSMLIVCRMSFSKSILPDSAKTCKYL